MQADSFGDGPTALVFAVVVFALVGYLAVVRPDIQRPSRVPATQADGGLGAIGVGQMLGRLSSGGSTPEAIRQEQRDQGRGHPPC